MLPFTISKPPTAVLGEIRALTELSWICTEPTAPAAMCCCFTALLTSSWEPTVLLPGPP